MADLTLALIGLAFTIFIIVPFIWERRQK